MFHGDHDRCIAEHQLRRMRYDALVGELCRVVDRVLPGLGVGVVAKKLGRRDEKSDAASYGVFDRNRAIGIAARGRPGDWCREIAGGGPTVRVGVEGATDNCRSGGSIDFGREQDRKRGERHDECKRSSHGCLSDEELAPMFSTG